MVALGMTMLGVFVGAVITIGIRQTEKWTDLQKFVTTVLTAALSGVVLAFLKGLDGSGGAASYYPVGLVLGLVWANAPAARENVQSPARGVRTLGWLHFVGLVLLTVLVAGLLFWPDFRELLPPDVTSGGDHGTA